MQLSKHPTPVDATIKCIKWNPKSPLSLTIPTNAGTLPLEHGFNDIHASSGIGINIDEVSALLSLIDARENSSNNDSDGGGASPVTLCQTYRRILADCLNGWETRILEDEHAQNTDTELQNVCLLKDVMKTVHLSEVFLLSSTSGISYAVEPGSRTASTLRFLRYFLPHPLDDEGEVEDLLASPQPEYYSSHANENSGGDGDDGTPPFWRLIRALTSRGLVMDAWKILSHHSILAGNVNTEDAMAFATLRDLLYSAPLPGGRDDAKDAGFGGNDDTTMEEEDITMASVLGIPSDAHTYWEGDAGSVGRCRGAYGHWMSWSRAVRDASRMDGALRGLMNKLPFLQTAVLDVLTGDSDPMSFGGWEEALLYELLYKQPNIHPDDISVRAESLMEQHNLNQNSNTDNDGEGLETETAFQKVILSVMNGDAGKAINTVFTFGGGSGAALPAAVTALLCDLLVMVGRIPRHMVLSDTNDSYMLDQDDYENPLDHEIDLRCELFQSAAISCESSFVGRCGTEEEEVGVKCAARLLLIENSARSIVAVHELLSRRQPNSDEETKSLLRLCERRNDYTNETNTQNNTPKNKPIDLLFEAGRSVAMARSRYYRRDNRPGGAAFWMLRAIEMETKLSSCSTGNHVTTTNLMTAMKRLSLFCIESTKWLLKSLLLVPPNHADSSNSSERSDYISRHYTYGREILTTMENDAALSLLDGDTSGSFLMLQSICDLTTSFVSSIRIVEAGKSIIRCLADRQIRGGCGGALVKPLVPVELWLDLLKIAYVLLEEVETAHHLHKVLGEDGDEDADANENEKKTKCSSAFDVAGMHVLMTRFREIEDSIDAKDLFQKSGIDIVDIPASSNNNKNTPTTNMGNSLHDPYKFTPVEMHLLLGRGLMRAFVAQNGGQLKQISRQLRQEKQKSDEIVHAPPVCRVGMNTGGGGNDIYLSEQMSLLLGPPDLCGHLGY